MILVKNILKKYGNKKVVNDVSVNIEKGKIGYTCTYCGDCLSTCKHGGLEYRFFKLRPATAERLWIIITVVLHTCFLMIARI